MKEPIRTLIILSTGFCVFVFLIWAPKDTPDYTSEARKTYEIEGAEYYPPFMDRLGSIKHWLSCEATTRPTETIAECAERIGCFTDSDCIEWEHFIKEQGNG